MARNGKESEVGDAGPSAKRGRKPGPTKWPFTVRMTREQIRWLRQHYGWVQAGLDAVVQGAIAATEEAASGPPPSQEAEKKPKRAKK